MIKLPDLPYGYDALQPTMSADTLHTHHDKHHRKYVDETNKLALVKGLADADLETIIKATAGGGGWTKLHNNATQAWNHAFFWNAMTPDRAAAPKRFAGLKAEFIEKGAAHFGSGWVWITLEGEKLAVADTHDGENFVGKQPRPLLACDLWEHAYYLDHKNDRQAFLEGFWDKLANWAFAEAQFEAASHGDQGWTFAQAA